MRRVLALLPALFAGQILFARPKDVSIKTVSSVQNATFPIVCGFLDAQNKFHFVKSAGTGFLVDRNGKFLTAAHVVKDWQKYSTPAQPCFPAVYIPVGGWPQRKQRFTMRWLRFESCDVDLDLDIALCQTVENPFRDPALAKTIHPLRFRRTLLPEGAPLGFTGFPLEALQPITSKGSVASYQEVIDPIGPRTLLIDKIAWPGASGSPVYDSDGRVIGVIRQRGIGDATGLAFARTTNSMEAFLKKNGIRTED